MNKIVASVSLVALGTTGLHAAAGSAEVGSRPWSASASFNGFYDDNVNAAGDKATLGSFHRSSSGIEISPSLSFAWPWEQTTFSAKYTYTFKLYDNKPLGNTDNIDQIHTFDVGIDHTFNENVQVSAHNSFVVGQEPDLLRTENTFSTFSRVAGNNIRNYATVTADDRISPLLAFEAAYANALYHYADDRQGGGNTGLSPSTAGVLDRMEQTVRLDSRWELQPETTAVLGYEFMESDYTAGQFISTDYMSDSRNSHAHYGYVGLDHKFAPELTGGLRAGARYTDYFNAPGDSSSVSPYVQLSLRYTYADESYLEGGFTQDRAATFLTSYGGSGLTLDAETSTLYASLYHRIAPKLYGSILLQFQNSDYNGGSFNGDSEKYYTAGLNLEYRFSPNLSAHIGYNYDRLDSVSGIETTAGARSFDRNRVYLGLTATY